MGDVPGKELVAGNEPNPLPKLFMEGLGTGEVVNELGKALTFAKGSA